MKTKKHKITWSAIFKVLVVLSVAAAYIYGLLGEERDSQEKLLLAYPEMSVQSTEGKNPVLYRTDFPEGERYVLLYKTMGWGGPALVATTIDSSGIVEEMMVVDHKETPSFYSSLEKNDYFAQFKGKYIGDSFSFNDDVNAVSGATISSHGFNTAVKESCHYLAAEEFQLEIPMEKARISFSGPAYLILLLFALAYFGSRFGFSKYRIAVQLAAIVILGFILSFPLSMSHIASLFMGFFPNPETNMTWYILIGCIVLMLLFLGKNFYCSWICPFGAIQDLMHKASGISLPVPPRVKYYARKSAGFIAWLSICAIFISRNPATGTFEPFAALFSFKGFGIIWIVLPVLIFSSFFIKRMWCSYFCPVGFFLNGTCKMRNRAFHPKHSTHEKKEVNISRQHVDHCA